MSDRTLVVFILLAALPLHTHAGTKIDPRSLEEIVVLGQPEFLQKQFDAERLNAMVDASKLIASVPGGAANDNGPLSGQIQYRGLYGPRVNVLLDGMQIHGGGPNWMAPPLHHIPASLMESLSVTRGIASVSAGGGIGGTVEATWKRPGFSESNDWRLKADLETSIGSTDDGRHVAALAGAANSTNRIFVLGSFDTGNDFEFNDHTASATEYRRDAYGVSYGFSDNAWHLDVDIRRIDTDDTGTPALPMDIDYFHSDLWNINYGFSMAVAELDLQVYGSRIDHRMDNFGLRPAPDFSTLPLPPFTGADRRLVDADSRETGIRLTASFNVEEDYFSLGLDGHRSEQQSTVYDPDFTPFFINNFDDTETKNWAFFGEWSRLLSDKWYLETGFRLEQAVMKTGEVDGFPARMVDMNPNLWPMGTPPRAVWLLREQFNNQDLTQSDLNLDWVLKSRYKINNDLALEVALAQKSRSPIYQERYLWIPLEVNAGIGDGNNYIGNTELDSEVSRQLEVGLDWRTGRLSVSPRAFFRRIDDYIQGVPTRNMIAIAVSSMANGDPTPLEFSNVEAELYGFDISFESALSKHLRFDGIVSWVRGQRRDINDDLYRIAPASMRLSVTWENDYLLARFEQVLVAAQENISRTNTHDPANQNNQYEPTHGYGLSNLLIRYRINHDLTVTAGIENLWDKTYTDHLTGFNRVMESDIAVGHRMPGQGRHFFARLRYLLN
jgi:iron complex outermembrane receptor protein